MSCAALDCARPSSSRSPADVAPAPASSSCRRISPELREVPLTPVNELPCAAVSPLSPPAPSALPCCCKISFISTTLRRALGLRPASCAPSEVAPECAPADDSDEASAPLMPAARVRAGCPAARALPRAPCQQHGAAMAERRGGRPHFVNTAKACAPSCRAAAPGPALAHWHALLPAHGLRLHASLPFYLPLLTPNPLKLRDLCRDRICPRTAFAGSARVPHGAPDGARRGGGAVLPGVAQWRRRCPGACRTRPSRAACAGSRCTNARERHARMTRARTVRSATRGRRAAAATALGTTSRRCGWCRFVPAGSCGTRVGASRVGAP